MSFFRSQVVRVQICLMTKLCPQRFIFVVIVVLTIIIGLGAGFQDSKYCGVL